MQVRILFVEDSQDDAELLLARLRSSDLAPNWLRVASEGELREALASSDWQVALVDYDLPGFSGPEALRILAHIAPDLPAITVSGAISEETAAATINAGAVDFVLKDNLTRLASAVKRALENAELRRLQRKAAEQARLSEFAVDHASQAIVYVNEDGVVLYGNAAAGRLAGIAPEAAIGEEIWAWYPHLSREDWRRLWRAAAAGPVEDVEATLRRADGGERAVSITLDHVEREEGAFVIAYVRDITESKRAQADLRFTQFAVERVGDPVYWIEADGAFKYANPAACESLGYTLDELRTMTMHDIDPKFSPHWSQHISELKEAGSLTFETQHRRRDGTLVPVEVTAAYLDYDGVAYDVGFARDITERKRADEALAHSRDLLDYVVGHASSAIAIHDRDLNYVYVSQRYLDEYGIEGQNVIGRHHYDVFPDLPQKWRDVHQRALAGEVCGADRDRFDRADGSVDWTRWECRPWYEADGTVGGIIVYTEVITDRVLAEEAQRESEAMLTAAERVAHVGSWRWEPSTQKTSWSPEMYRLYDVDPGEFQGDFSPILDSRVHPDDREGVSRATATVAATGEPIPVEYRVVHRDGSEHIIHGEGMVEHDEAGGVASIVGYYQDVTEQRRLEEAQRESERRFAAFATYVPGRLWIRDGDLRYLYVNPQLAADLGGPESDFLGKTPEELWDEATAAVSRDMCQRALEGEIVDVTERWPDVAGSGFYRSLVFSLAGGEGAGMLGGLMFDVTEQRAAQEEVRRRVEQLDHIVEGSVLAMSQIVESRDPYTAGHERRVAELAVAIGAEMGLGGPKLDGLRLASLIHDIGKISVPAEILSKPGKLSVVEFNLIKQHSQAGYDILAAIEFQQPVAQIVGQHHERLDGSGYPQGLSGEEIMQEARILAVADVVEAMSSHRPYRPALGMGPALAEIREGAGARYDAEAAAACLALVEAKGFEFSD